MIQRRRSNASNKYIIHEAVSNKFIRDACDSDADPDPLLVLNAGDLVVVDGYVVLVSSSTLKLFCGGEIFGLDVITIGR